MAQRPDAPGAAAIFDLDGLLVDSEPFWLRAELEVFDRAGIDVRPLVGRGHTLGLRVDDAVAFFRSRLGFAGPSDAEFAAQIVARVVAAIEEEGALLPGALDALDLLESAGVPLALASGSAPPVIEAVLERFSLAGRFAAVCSAVDEEHGKPHPAVFLRAARLLGVEPTRCVVLEDAVNGVVAAKAARMSVIAVPAERHRGDRRYALADLVLDSLEQLADPAALALFGLEGAPGRVAQASARGSRRG